MSTERRRAKSNATKTFAESRHEIARKIGRGEEQRQEFEESERARR
jgi:hypothetical protein